MWAPLASLTPTSAWPLGPVSSLVLVLSSWLYILLLHPDSWESRVHLHFWCLAKRFICMLFSCFCSPAWFPGCKPSLPEWYTTHDIAYCLVFQFLICRCESVYVSKVTLCRELIRKKSPRWVTGRVGKSTKHNQDARQPACWVAFGWTPLRTATIGLLLFRVHEYGSFSPNNQPSQQFDVMQRN